MRRLFRLLFAVPVSPRAARSARRRSNLRSQMRHRVAR